MGPVVVNLFVNGILWRGSVASLLFLNELSQLWSAARKIIMRYPSYNILEGPFGEEFQQGDMAPSMVRIGSLLRYGVWSWVGQCRPGS